MTMRDNIDPTITIHKFDRVARLAVAGVFETTPKGLFVYLGGQPEYYDEGTEVMMEWHLRALGYERREHRPLCWTPMRVSWVRTERWPEDGPWIKGSLLMILDHLDSVCD